MNSSSFSLPTMILEMCLENKHVGIIVSLCLLSFCFLVATPAHLWCLWFCFKVESKSKPTPVFLLNQMILELIYCLDCCLEVLCLLIFRGGNINRAIVFSYGVTRFGNPVLQICICMEQYLAVVYPVIFLRLKGSRYRIVVTAACWSMAVGFGLYQAIADRHANTVLVSVFLVAVAVISFCCVSVLCALKNPKPGDQHQKSSDVGNQQKRNAFNTISTALILTLFMYLPQTLLLCPALNVSSVLYKCDLVPLMTSFYVLGVIITPLLKMYKENYLFKETRSLPPVKLTNILQ